MAPVKAPKPSTQAKRGTRSSSVTKQPRSSKTHAKRAKNGQFVAVKPDVRVSNALVGNDTGFNRSASGPLVAECSAAVENHPQAVGRSHSTPLSITISASELAKSGWTMPRIIKSLKRKLGVEEESKYGRWITWLESQLEAKTGLEERNSRLEEGARKDAEEYDALQEEITRLEEEAQEKAEEVEEEMERLQEEIDGFEADMEEKADEEEDAKQELRDEIDRLEEVNSELENEQFHLEHELGCQNGKIYQLQEEIDKLEEDALVLKSRLQTEIEHWYTASVGKQVPACQVYSQGDTYGRARDCSSSADTKYSAVKKEEQDW